MGKHSQLSEKPQKFSPSNVLPHTVYGMIHCIILIWYSSLNVSGVSGSFGSNWRILIATIIADCLAK